jgi:15-cis-phytoene synthase
LDEAERAKTIVAILREGDPDRYLATLFAPSSARDELFVLYALNVELARIGERVSEPDLGEIKLQWWRDALALAADGETTASPVVDAIGGLLRRHPDAAEPISRMINAREFDVAVKIMPDIAALNAYLDGTAGSLFVAAVTIGGVDAGRLQSLCAEAGRAFGLTGLMRSLPVHAARGRCDLPEDLLRRHGISVEDILVGQASPGLTSVLAELRGKAIVSLEHADRKLAELPARERKIFMPLALVRPYLASLAKVASDPFRFVSTTNPLYRLWRFATWR